MQWSVITWRSANPIQDTGGTTGVLGVMGYAISLRTLVVPRRPYIRCSVGRCLRRCRRLHRASARHKCLYVDINQILCSLLIAV